MEVLAEEAGGGRSEGKTTTRPRGAGGGGKGEFSTP